MEEKPRRFTVEVEPALHRRLKVMAALADMHLTVAVRRLIEREVEQPSVLKPKPKKAVRQKSGVEAA